MSEIALNEIWPDWDVVRRIGNGSYGVVYEVKKRDKLETRAAVKVISIPQNESELESLRAEGMTEEASRTYMENIKDDFVSEIRLMNNFKATQNIVSIEDYRVIEKKDRIGWDIYIRMELLTPFITYTSGHPLSELEIIKLGTDMCSALELCEKNKVIHRDIKPENIFVNKFGDFKLGDFGIARKLENVSGGLSQKGSFNYMAPEVVRGSHYDSRVDICSLGLVLYKLANNNCLPFVDPNKQLLTPNERARATQRRLDGEPFPPPVNTSKALSDAIMCACAPNPDRRFTTAAAMKSALEFAKEHLDPEIQQGSDGGNGTQRVNPANHWDGYSDSSDDDAGFSEQWNGTSGYQNGGQWNNYGGYGNQPGGSWNSAGGYGNHWGDGSGSGSYGNTGDWQRYRRDNDDSGNRGWKIFATVFFALLTVMAMVLLFFSSCSRSDQEDVEPVEETPVVVSETVTPTETAYPTVAVITATPTSTPTPTKDPTNDLNDLIETYLDSFITDVNNGSYNRLYSCVVSGSNMEKTQKEFIEKGVERGLEEDLTDYSITSRNKINDYTYHITVVETYDVWIEEDDEYSEVVQRCTYKVSKQRDGSWQIEDFVDQETISREVY